jgi:hypothetical protein
MVLSRWTGEKNGPGLGDPGSQPGSDPQPGSGPSVGQDLGPKFLTGTRRASVRRVSVFPTEGQNGKPCFYVSLELDSESDPSSLQRRTERVLSLELEIEEKELTALARLSGRELVIHYSRRTTEVQTEALQIEILDLTERNQKLRKRISALEEQLQFAIDQQRSVS